MADGLLTGGDMSTNDDDDGADFAMCIDEHGKVVEARNVNAQAILTNNGVEPLGPLPEEPAT